MQLENPFHKKRKKWPIILGAVVLVLFGLGAFAYNFVRNLTPEQILNSNFVQNVVSSKFGSEGKEMFDLVPKFLGFDEPRTYLLLFLNNTELRPGGGFIGAYATVRVDKGETEILVMEGTEKLDARTPANWNPTPPDLIKEQLHVDKWYFRDSNWSPDFEISSKKALEFYKAEGGVEADDIDAVIGITTNVLEGLLVLTGPVEIEGLEFTAENVTEKLEYEVEYGFDDKGVNFKDRKQIMKPLMLTILDKLKEGFFTHPNKYLETVLKFGAEKQVLVYAIDDELETLVDKKGWSGKMHETEGDYLIWVDANLAALKTDHAIKRHLTYTISERPAAYGGEEDYCVASAAMEYRHTGKFDWRTTRYRTYARIFVPEGSKLTTVIVNNGRSVQTLLPDQIDQGVENGKQWFGTFVSIEPGDKAQVEFIYGLSEQIEKTIDDGLYTLFVQKQAGTIDPGLTLNLDFAKNITGADPAEKVANWGDEVYALETDLLVDREFEIKF